MRNTTSIRNTFIIVIISVICLLLSIPKEIPLKFNYKKINIEGRIVRPDLDLKIFGKDFKRDLNLSLGLDLAGGSYLVFEADTNSVPDERKKNRLMG